MRDGRPKPSGSATSQGINDEGEHILSYFMNNRGNRAGV